MASAKEMRLRIRGVTSISQVTKALETVSASKVRKSMLAFSATRPYAEKAWKVLVHLARQPGGADLHPLLSTRPVVTNVLTLMISSDRGLAGAYNVNVVKNTLDHFRSFEQPIGYVAIGRKGRDMLYRRRKKVVADFSDLPAVPAFADVSAIGRLAVEEYLKGEFDEVYISYTEFESMVRQRSVVRKLLPLEVSFDEGEDPYSVTHHKTSSVFTFEPDENSLLDEIVPRFVALQVYRCLLSAQASEHAARMIAMRNATDSARDLISLLLLDYNMVRQQSITNEILDIIGGVNAMQEQA